MTAAFIAASVLLLVAGVIVLADLFRYLREARQTVDRLLAEDDE